MSLFFQIIPENLTNIPDGHDYDTLLRWVASALLSLLISMGWIVHKMFKEKDKTNKIRLTEKTTEMTDRLEEKNAEITELKIKQDELFLEIKEYNESMKSGLDNLLNAIKDGN